MITAVTGEGNWSISSSKTEYLMLAWRSKSKKRICMFVSCILQKNNWSDVSWFPACTIFSAKTERLPVKKQCLLKVQIAGHRRLSLFGPIEQVLFLLWCCEWQKCCRGKLQRHRRLISPLNFESNFSSASNSATSMNIYWCFMYLTPLPCVSYKRKTREGKKDNILQKITYFTNFINPFLQ